VNLAKVKREKRRKTDGGRESFSSSNVFVSIRKMVV